MTGIESRRLLAAAGAGLVALGAAAAPVQAGAYVFAGEVNGIDIVTHPTTYTGTGGEITVTVCVDPTSPSASDMEGSVRNLVRTFNALSPTSPNLFFGGDNNIPSNDVDFESVALHEVGHCLGMAHVNLSTESGLPDPDTDYTKSTDGDDNGIENETAKFNLDDGADNLIGSLDDARGDDGNLHWFRMSNNNPFTIAGTVDSTTYSRSLADLPGGSSFAENADRTVAAARGFADTEAVMQQLTFSDEEQRDLNHDDVATLRYAMSGLDEIAGTADDYTVRLEYAGLTSSCNVVLKFDDFETGFAVCEVSGVFLDATHVRITAADAFFNTGFNWFFNPDEAAELELVSVGGEDGWLRESSETSGVGGKAVASKSGTNGLRVGDDKADRQFRTIVSFDTSAVPDDATILSATLRLRRGKLVGTNPFDRLGACRVDIRTGAFGGSTALAPGDFEAAATASNVATLSNATTNGAWSEGDLDAAGLAAINRTGRTQLRVYFAVDDDDDLTNDYMGYHPGEASAANRPQLVIAYEE